MSESNTKVEEERSEDAEDNEEDVFFLDDSLTPLERFKQCASSEQPFMRYTEARRIAETVNALDFEKTASIVMPTLTKLLDDEAWQVRLETVKQLPAIASVLIARGKSEGYRLVIDVLIRQLTSLFEDQVPDIRAETVSTFSKLATFVRESDLGEKVLTLVIQFAHDDANEDKRIAAAELLHILAPIVGPALALQFVFSEVVSLSEDHAFRVRKAVALHIESSFDKRLPATYHKKILQTFIGLCHDDAWPVRKVCVEKLTQISYLCDPSFRVGYLVPEFATLANDSSDWVKKAVFKSCGAFITTLTTVDSAITSTFVGILVPKQQHHQNGRSNGGTRNAEAGVDAFSVPDAIEIATTCASHFPDILAAIGGQRWSELRTMFHVLANHDSSTVRAVMAASLARVAVILGPDDAEKELVDTLDEFLEDEPQVRKNVVSHLVELLAALGPECRESYLAVLADVMQSTRASPSLSWRFRMFLGRQLQQLS
eukprot:g5047.t1